MFERVTEIMSFEIETLCESCSLYKFHIDLDYDFVNEKWFSTQVKDSEI